MDFGHIYRFLGHSSVLEIGRDVMSDGGNSLSSSIGTLFYQPCLRCLRNYSRQSGVVLRHMGFLELLVKSVVSLSQQSTDKSEV